MYPTKGWARGSNILRGEKDKFIYIIIILYYYILHIVETAVGLARAAATWEI